MNDLERPRGEKPGGKQQLVLLILLLLFFLSSYLVFFMTGKNGDRPVKLPSDTIVLTPDGGETGTAFHFGGKILCEDGTPFAGGTVELQSETRTTVTDEYGRFLFDNVESGKHTLKAVDKEGKVLAQCRFLLSKTEMEEPLFFIEKGPGEYELQANINLRFLEITAQIHNEDQVLVLQPDMSTLNYAGILHTPGGSHDIKNGLATVTPAGLVILPDGHIILPGKEYIKPDDTMVELTDEAYVLPDGTRLSPDGKTQLPCGAAILPDGTVRLPDKRSWPLVPEGDYLYQDMKVYPIGGGPEAEENQNAGLEESQENTEPPEQESTPSGENGSGSKNQGGGGKSGGGGPEEGDDEPPEPITGVPIQGFQGGKNWTALTHINLFGQRAEEGTPLEIRPGSKGSYTFNLKNGNSYPMMAAITMSDEQNPGYRLGFVYRLKETWNGAWLVGDENTWLTPEAFASQPIRIEPRMQRTYTLEWYWPYERASASIVGDATPVNGDIMDTKAGIADGTYYLELTVSAELIQ